MTRITIRQAAAFVAALAALYGGTALLPHAPAPDAPSDADRTVLLGE